MRTCAIPRRAESKRLRRLAFFAVAQPRKGSVIWPAMSGSGPEQIIIRSVSLMTLLSMKVFKDYGAKEKSMIIFLSLAKKTWSFRCCGAARGTTSSSTPAVRTAAGATRATGSTLSGFVAPGQKNSPLSFYSFTLCTNRRRRSKIFLTILFQGETAKNGHLIPWTLANVCLNLCLCWCRKCVAFKKCSFLSLIFPQWRFLGAIYPYLRHP
jgi:hypothetical protein